MSLSAVILNDTRGESHFGCHRVMRLIEQNLLSRGIQVTASSQVRNHWERDSRFLREAKQSDLILINGEGTLHHGSKYGERLLRVVTHPISAGRPVALINATYQENPTPWADYLRKIQLISARDSRSATALSQAVGRQVSFVPDLSLSAGLDPCEPAAARGHLLIGDSVHKEATRKLLGLVAARTDARFLPITRFIKSHKPELPQPLRALRELYIRMHAFGFKLAHQRAIFAPSEEVFIEALRGGWLHLTGRFHGVCFCLFTQTPFLALESNTWKVQALLEDFQLRPDRLVTLEQAVRKLANGEPLAFTPDELEKIHAGMRMCQDRAKALFDRVAALAREAHAQR